MSSKYLQRTYSRVQVIETGQQCQASASVWRNWNPQMMPVGMYMEQPQVAVSKKLNSLTIWPSGSAPVYLSTYMAGPALVVVLMIPKGPQSNHQGTWKEKKFITYKSWGLCGTQWGHKYKEMGAGERRRDKSQAKGLLLLGLRAGGWGVPWAQSSLVNFECMSKNLQWEEKKIAQLVSHGNQPRSLKGLPWRDSGWIFIWSCGWWCVYSRAPSLKWMPQQSLS